MRQILGLGVCGLRMFYEQLTTCDDDRPAVVNADGAKTWRDLRQMVQQQCIALAECRGQRVAVQLPASPLGVAGLAALQHLGCHVFLMDAQHAESDCLQLARDLSLHALLSPRTAEEFDIHGVGHASAEVVPGGVTVLTSGTEGPPKAVNHTWESLCRPVRRSGGQTWALCYRLHLYAGLQVMLQAMMNQGQLVIPAVDAEPNEIAKLLAAHRVTHLSATPSYVRRLLLFAERAQVAQIPLRQVTMGGEVVDQTVLDGIRAVFRHARVVHIYATSELGRCFSVTDGREGFPKRYLEPDALGGVQLRVVDGELQVRSANSMLGYDRGQGPEGGSGGAGSDGWRATGDLVDVGDQRVLFAGRRGDMINVGGNKVCPIKVERVARNVLGVSDVRVFGQRSSLAGELVACEVVLQEGADEGSVRQALAERCGRDLNRYEVPRIISFVPEIATSDAGKVRRRS